jgi:hypothetical protein
MRAWDLVVVILLMEMTIGFFAALGELPSEGGGGWLPHADDQYFTPDQDKISKFMGKNASDTWTTDTEQVDYLSFAVSWVFASMNMIIDMIAAFTVVSWVLYSQFHLDMGLCMYIQGIVYFIYTWAFIQWRSGRSGRGYE